VIVRGGGSLESLQAFNNEVIVRMIADFPVPVIAGVGHDEDETITTLVADHGASTPTAAAHAVRESWDQVDKFITSSEQYIMHEFDKALTQQRTIISEQESKISQVFESILQRARDLFGKFNFAVQKIDNEIKNKEKNLQNNLKQLAYSLDKIVLNYKTILERAQNTFLQFGNVVRNNKKQIIFLEKALENNNPDRQLKLGYSIATNEKGKVVRSVRDVKKDDKINVQVSDGKIKTIVNK
ncbi:MAG: exodeoxyribonuclease VII large subunit, partial [Patescibacteria group bacterium]